MYYYTQVPIIGLSLAIVYLQTEWAAPTLAIVMIVFSMFFYWLTYSLLAGLSASELDFKEHWKSIWVTRLTHILAAIALTYEGGPYYYVVAFILPWLLVNSVSDTLNTLIQIGYLSIESKEED